MWTDNFQALMPNTWHGLAESRTRTLQLKRNPRVTNTAKQTFAVNVIKAINIGLLAADKPQSLFHISCITVISGSEVKYTNWGPYFHYDKSTRPNACVLIDKNSSANGRVWRDSDCGETKRFVCQNRE